MIFQLGDKFNEKFVVKKEIYDGFVDLFQDENPLHTNRHFAIEKGFKDVVMHGNILNGFLSYFVGEKLPTKEVIIHSQEIQFKHPVYLNDTLIFDSKIIEIYESVHAIVFKFSFKNMEAQIVAKGKLQIGLLK